MEDWCDFEQICIPLSSAEYAHWLERHTPPDSSDPTDGTGGSIPPQCHGGSDKQKADRMGAEVCPQICADNIPFEQYAGLLECWVQLSDSDAADVYCWMLLQPGC